MEQHLIQKLFYHFEIERLKKTYFKLANTNFKQNIISLFRIKSNRPITKYIEKSPD
ncbi:hypothetical protein U752_11285 [Streptococcus pseudopneumoniae 1321]|nr:hypothetical protein U752_11285 [Streptococcus pseudopneumoniae 1321]